MADWQVEFAIVPRRALAGTGPASPGNVIALEWWNSGTLPADFTKHLASIAPAAASGTTEVQRWGEPEGNHVDVWSADGRVTRVIARVDVRRLDSKFGAMLLKFARVADAVLIRSDGLIIEPLVGAFAAALRNSKQWRFANDPATFLRAYSEDEDEA
jgi:hypothetical protein